MKTKTLRLSLLTKFILFFTTICYCQEQNFWTVEGQIVGAKNERLVQALVYVSPIDSTNQFISFSNSDRNGDFKLNIPSSYDKVLLQVRYLGYNLHREEIERSLSVFRAISMELDSNTLEEVIVSDERPPVIVKSDTTSYSIDHFRDSTEYNVEDLIKRLPGVNVKENGEISVGGRNIKTVLIEGENLLGKKYTIGTKSIRADFIDKIEVIDHYQENPVLKNVNFSNDVVLNLLIKAEKKNILNGTVNGGIGFGDELKSKLHANIFSISRKHKIISLTDNGNIGTHYGINELKATYQDFDNANDIRSFNPLSPELILQNSIKNPGINPAYIDNGISNFVTIRSIHNIKEDWKLQINSIWANKKDEQITASRASFGLNESKIKISADD